jgi:DUF1365 family protein
LAIVIRETGPDGDILLATRSGRRRALRDRGLLRGFLALPLVTIKVIAGIHWQALGLWRKGAAYRPRPPAPAKEVTS